MATSSPPSCMVGSTSYRLGTPRGATVRRSWVVAADPALRPEVVHRLACHGCAASAASPPGTLGMVVVRVICGGVTSPPPSGGRTGRPRTVAPPSSCGSPRAADADERCAFDARIRSSRTRWRSSSSSLATSYPEVRTSCAAILAEPSSVVRMASTSRSLQRLECWPPTRALPCRWMCSHCWHPSV